MTKYEYGGNQRLKSNVFSLNNLILGLCMLAMATITFFDVRGTGRIVVILGILTFYMGLKYQQKACFLFFLLPFTADISLAFVTIQYKTVLQVIFIINIILFTKLGLNSKVILSVVYFVIMQVIAMFVFDQNLANMGSFIVNILLMYIVGELIRDEGEKLFRSFLASFAIGTIFSLVAGYYRDTNASWMRFTGLWTDPNFLSMFCIIAFLSLLVISRMELKKIFLFSPLLIMLMYFGNKTYSRTFAIVVGFVTIFILISLLKNKKMGTGTKLIIIILSSVFFIFIVHRYIFPIIEKRGIIAYAGSDWTAGRLANTRYLLNEWRRNIFAIVFGVGANNSINFLLRNSLRGTVSHNTVVDVMVEFGLGGFAVIATLFVVWLKGFRVKMKNFWSIEGSIVIALLVYTMSLSQIKYDFFFMFLGIVPFILSKKEDPERELSIGELRSDVKR